MRKSDVVDWYLEQIQDTIDTEQELIEKKTIIDKVIERLIYKVRQREVSPYEIRQNVCLYRIKS